MSENGHSDGRPGHAAGGAVGHARVARVEVRPTAAAGDVAGRAVERQAASLGLPVARAQTAKLYLLEPDDGRPLGPGELHRIVAGLLVDPVVEAPSLGAAPAPVGASVVEVHPLPGVMDPAAESVADGIRELTGRRVRVATGRRYELFGLTRDQADVLARRALANPVIHRIAADALLPESLPAGHETPFALRRVPLLKLSDAELERLSRDAHLFLDLAEMRAIQGEYQRLGREPTDIELETLAQTWSEHCVHKTLKSTIRYRAAGTAASDPVRRAGRPGHEAHADGSVTIHNLLKSTVAAATHELIAEGIDWTLSVFVDNSGVIAFDDQHAVCIKVETHNHPSAIEPYGGAATGAGGCIRDVIGTGLGAKPIASTDVFCVAPPDTADVPDGCIHPRTVLTQVVAGVRDYGNRMGIPTLNGAVWFDPRHIGNPLVFCGCVGLMRRGDRDALIRGVAKPGDLIIALGGRTGRDGVHGATFSSAELTDTHADEFAHAVQIGNAITEKRLLDAVLRARDDASGPLFNAITDCGAGGFSSAVGEMGEKLGADVVLDRAPLKYAGLSYTEVWISEAQERMVLAVPPGKLGMLRAICDEEGVELAELGRFGHADAAGNAQLRLTYRGHVVGELSMHFLHDGLPMPTRVAEWMPQDTRTVGNSAAMNNRKETPEPREALLRLLAHPNIASKHWIIRQYDHEVQGNTVVKPLVGPGGRGPGDAAVIEPVPGTGRGLAIACGLATGRGDPALGGDPYHMALAAIDECVRNLVCVGADPARIAILDNFCFPTCKKPGNLAALVRTAEGCYDGAKAYRTPFISGKDSLSNQFTTKEGRTIEIPPTLLITGIGIVPQLSRVVTMDAKRPGSALIWVTGATGTSGISLAGSHYAAMFDITNERTDDGRTATDFPSVDLAAGPAAAHAVAALIRTGRVRAAHDISDGGLLVALAEMLIAGSTPHAPLGASIGFQGAGPDAAELFGEAPSSYLLEIDPITTDEQLEALDEHFERAGVSVLHIGHITNTGVLSVNTSWSGDFDVPVEQLASAWRGTLDW